MADTAAQPQAGGGGEGQGEQPKPWWHSTLQILFFMILFNVLMGTGRNANRPSNTSPESSDNEIKPAKGLYANQYLIGDSIKLAVYVSETETWDGAHDLKPIWTHSAVFGEWDEAAYHEPEYFELTPSNVVLNNNGTLFAHILCDGPHGKVHRRHALITYKPWRRNKKTKNLLESIPEDSVDPEPESTTYLPYFHPNVTVSMMYEHVQLNPAALPPPLLPHVAFNESSNTYEPILYVNEFWNLKDYLIPVNDTIETLPLYISFQALGLFKWQLYVSMDESLKQQQQQWSGSLASEESDTFKQMLMDTNPWLLALTAVVTIFHSIFDFLAFKNDIQFWRTRKSVEGLSVRSIFINLFFQTVILLYLFDNDTSYTILISSTIGLCIEFWKITKAVHVKVDSTHKILGLVPRVRFVDRKTYKESRTKEYDDMAFRTLSKICMPLVACYAIYSLVYREHKSFYSWALGSLVGAIYTFGFIMMTPQLFINYKLKSVAHMPWRMMTYKALNTFIDDLFAFIIKMPWLHRLACLRDDVIFFIYLYQRWVYPVDPNRRNEYEGGDAVGGKDDPPTDEEGDETEEKSTVSHLNGDAHLGDSKTDKASLSSTTSEDCVEDVHEALLPSGSENITRSAVNVTSVRQRGAQQPATASEE